MKLEVFLKSQCVQGLHTDSEFAGHGYCICWHGIFPSAFSKWQCRPYMIFSFVLFRVMCYIKHHSGKKTEVNIYLFMKSSCADLDIVVTFI